MEKIIDRTDIKYLNWLKERCFRHFATHEKLSGEDIYEIAKRIGLILDNLIDIEEN